MEAASHTVADDAPEEFQNMLQKVERSSPRVAAALRRAQENREGSLKRWQDDRRIQGLDHLLAYLEAASRFVATYPRLSKIAFLVQRALDDFEVALEATASGTNSVVFDAMRDVLEIEYLLSDFAAKPENIERWLAADDRLRSKEFTPASLRQRKAARLGVKSADLPTAKDYKGHSQLLHVSPHLHPFALNGIMSNRNGIQLASCFWDMYLHGAHLAAGLLELIAQVTGEEVTDDQLKVLNPNNSLQMFMSVRDQVKEEEGRFWDHVLAE